MLRQIINKLKGFTLVELLIASSIFAISFGTLMVGQKAARFHAENALINLTSLQYAQSLLEAIQTYPYEDSKYTPSDPTNPTYSEAQKPFTEHSVTFSVYDTNDSGVYADTDVTWGSPIEKISEEQLSLKYYPTTSSSSNTALNPFNISSSLTANTFLIGPEGDDIDGLSNASLGKFRIKQTDREMNIFANNGKGQEKYFYMDDVDDFDGYTETRNVMSDTSVKFEVSVSAIYRNSDNYTYTIRNNNGSEAGTATITQNRLSIMDLSNININFLKNTYTIPSGTDIPDQQAAMMGYGFLRFVLFKKITIKVTWEYPKGSGKQHTIVIDGGKINPSSGSYLI